MRAHFKWEIQGLVNESYLGLILFLNFYVFDWVAIDELAITFYFI